MGKEGELWDDSALVNAFDDAMSKYKIMHNKKKHQGGQHVTHTGDDVVDGSSEATRDREEKKSVVLNTVTEREGSNVFSSIKEDHCVELHATEAFLGVSNEQTIQDADNLIKDYSYLHSEETSSQLISQYYELEEKRQKIIQQLYQYGYQFSDPSSVSGGQYGSYAPVKNHMVPAINGSHSTTVYSCCPYVCPCPVASCTSLPACSSGQMCHYGTCTGSCETKDQGQDKLLTLKDDNIVKTAMRASERAISSMNMMARSVDSHITEEKLKEVNESDLAQTTSSETDLTVVLNAWYSAGFYTGKYLTEQATEKKGHD